MNEEEEPSVPGTLPHSRPHRRSAKRETRPVGGPPPPPPQESEEDDTAATGGTDGMGTAELLTTVVQAAAELAEIGLTAGARALRIAVSRLPHP